MTTTSQDRKFIADVIGDSLLDLSISWIANNLEPGDVFNDRQLESWAISSGFTKIEP